MKIPKFYYVDVSPPTCTGIRELLVEMVERGANATTVDLLGRLAITQPVHRLESAMVTVANKLASDNVHRIMDHGLNDAETEALLDLDRRGYTKASAVVARALLCVKERWALVKATQSYFRRCRMMPPDGYLDPLGAQG